MHVFIFVQKLIGLRLQKLSDQIQSRGKDFTRNFCVKILNPLPPHRIFIVTDILLKKGNFLSFIQLVRILRAGICHDEPLAMFFRCVIAQSFIKLRRTQDMLPAVADIRILTDRGTEYCGKLEPHDYQLYLGINVIEHTKAKARHPQNGICARFHKPILHEFYQVAFRRKLYHPLEELQVDLDAWLDHYNNERTHQGKRCCNRTSK